jgi:HAE1 family hydrophobic/amphiphilic exporter-1
MYGGIAMNSDLNEKKIKVNIFGKAALGFINQFQLTILVMLLIISIGIAGILNLPKESLPEIVFPSLTIQTLFPGASPEDVEFLVTEKIENKVKEFDDIDSISSDTSFGFSVVSISYVEGVDIDKKKIEVDNALKELQFSDGVQDPRSFIFSTSEIPLLNISVAGDYSQDQLTLISQDIANEIEGVRGVQDVTLSGNVKREIEVVTNELSMMKYDIDYNTLRNAISSQNYSAPVGEVSLNGVRYNLRVDERFQTIEDIENTRVNNNIYVKDIADVVDGIEPVTTYNRTFIKGLNDKAYPSISLSVSRKVGSDVIGTSQAVQELLEDQRGLLYPSDVTVYVSNDLAVNVANDLDKIQGSAFSGLIVVIIVLFLFIGIKESLIVSITIPLSLLGTLGLLSVFGITFNTFAILGLIVALGLLVDNSIIVMENIDRLKKKGMSSKDAAFYGTNQVGFPIVSSTFTTLAAFFPLAILPGILGAFISTIPLTIMITISVALLVSIVITPSIASKILNDKHRVNLHPWLKGSLSVLIVAGLSFYAFYDGGDNLLLAFIMMSIFTTLMLLKVVFLKENGLEDAKFTKKYSLLIGWIVSKKRRAIMVIVIGIATLGMSFLTFTNGMLKIAFFPNGEPTSLNIKVDTAGGMTLASTDIVVKELEEILMSTEAVSQFNSTIGGNEIDSARVSVEFDISKKNGFDILNEIDEKIKMIPGANISIQSVVAGPPVGKPIELRILGEDLKNSSLFANDVENTLKGLSGVFNIESSSTQGVPQLIIDIDKNKSLEYGVTPSQITNQLRGELNGVTASTIRSGKEEIDIVIRKDLATVQSLNEVENLFVATPALDMLTISSVADLLEQAGISTISRKDGERVITITADLKEGFNVNDVVKELQELYPEQVIPNGVDLKYSGDVEGISQNFGNLFQSMILAIFLVFIILTLQFKSIGQPFIILSTIPMAVIGVIWGLIATGNEFGFYAFMGLVALVGIAVNDAIVLIDYINYLRSEGKSLVDAIMEAGKTRFNPVLATTLTTISGVLPLAFKEAYYEQFSYALIFGLMVTTVLTLIFIPTIYGLFASLSKKRKVVS